MITGRSLQIWTGWALALLAVWGLTQMGLVDAQSSNVRSYSDTLSTSEPGVLSNHTLRFRNEVVFPAGATLQLTPPPTFTTIGSSTFSARNVELYVGGSPRPATSTASAGFDRVDITPGSPGQITYTLDSGLGPIPASSQLEWRIGNHTSNSVAPKIATTTTGTTTGTTTIPGDSPGIQNGAATGTHAVDVRVFDGTQVAHAGFLIALVEKVGVGPVDTTSEIPAELSEGNPSGTVSGTVRGVEVSVKTNKFAFCHYDTEPGTDYADMSGRFDREDFWVFHTFTIEVQPDTDYSFYVRCIDLEDNINQTDYEISFRVGTEPTGEPNPGGEVEGDGSGTQDGGSPDADGGDTTGDGAGSTPLDEPGSSSGSGGSGGGGGSSGGGGGSSGGGFEDEPAPFRSGDGRVIINGFAYPNSTVTLLVDSASYTTTQTDAQGRFSETVDDIARGVYTFGVYATDEDDVRSSTFSTSFTVSGARTSSLSNINVPPTINISPDPVDPGDTVTLEGYAIPDATVTIEHEAEDSAASRQTFTVMSDSSGAWSREVDTTGFPNGPHRVRTRAELDDGTRTSFSQYVRYGVGEEVADGGSSDLNRDGSVNLTDFSILLFWWNSDGGDSDPPADINGDGNVSLTDFSILLFNWTG